MDEITIQYWTMIISGFSMIVELVLTIIIIFQTHKNAKNQQELEIKFNEQQQMMQEKQYRIDTLPFKREIYINLYKIFQRTQIIKDIVKISLLKEKTLKEIGEIYECIDDVDIIDSSKVMLSLKEAEYIFPKNIYSSIKCVEKAYDEMVSTFKICKTLSSIFQDPESIEEIKQENIDKISNNIEIILKNANFLTNIIPEYIKIY